VSPQSTSPFCLGEIVCTKGVRRIVHQLDIVLALSRHLHGDRGEAGAEASTADQLVCSEFRDRCGTRFKVITCPAARVTIVSTVPHGVTP